VIIQFNFKFKSQHWPRSKEASNTELEDCFDEAQRQECENKEKPIDTLKEPVCDELYNNTTDHQYNVMNC